MDRQTHRHGERNGAFLQLAVVNAPKMCYISFFFCEISSSHDGEYDGSSILGCCAVQSGISLLTF
jgi:hypothetical protein